MLRKRLRRWPSGCFIYFFHKSPFFLQCAVDADLVECDPNTVMSTPAFFKTVTHHLEMVDVVMRLWGLTKLIKRFWSFRRSLVFSIYCWRWLTTQISWSGYLKSTIGSWWCPGRDCFNNSGTRIVTLSASNIIKSVFILEQCLVSLTHRRIASRYNRFFKSHCFKALSLLLYFKTTDTSHVVEYLGRAGLKNSF